MPTENPDRPDPQLYRKAAERIAKDRNRFSCLAIRHEECFWITEGGEHERQYSLMFEPRTYTEWRTHPFWNRGHTAPSRDKALEREYRILALLFMADICEQGG